MGWANSAWKKEAQRRLRNELTKVVREDVRPKVDEQGRNLKPGRADMVGIEATIGLFATNALRKNHMCHIKGTKDEKLIDKEIATDVRKQQTIEGIVVGSFRGAVRLHKAGLVKEPKCQLCGEADEDQEHMSRRAVLRSTSGSHTRKHSTTW